MVPSVCVVGAEPPRIKYRSVVSFHGKGGAPSPDSVTLSSTRKEGTTVWKTSSRTAECGVKGQATCRSHSHWDAHDERYQVSKLSSLPKHLRYQLSADCHLAEGSTTLLVCTRTLRHTKPGGLHPPKLQVLYVRQLTLPRRTGCLPSFIWQATLSALSLIHISEPTRREWLSRMPSSA